MVHRVAVIPGDGVGVEVTAEAVKVLEAAARAFDFQIELQHFALGGQHWRDTGEVLDDATLRQLREFDAILLGAVGTPDVPPGVLERGLLLRIRFEFDQYVNLRPVKLYEGVPTPIARLEPDQCDLVVVRENTEGLYVGAGGVHRARTPSEVATQESINTRAGVERVVRYAFELAERRRRHLTLVHKTNVLTYAGDLWSRTVADVAAEFPDVETSYQHVDAMCLHLLNNPEWFDVVVTDNLFGDIITDLGAAVQGGLGLAASANLNPTRETPSMFEPVHGSAPDIAGRGWANPVAAILSVAMLLDDVGLGEVAASVEDAATSVLPDLKAMGGAEMGMSTGAIGDLIAERLSQSA